MSRIVELHNTAPLIIKKEEMEGDVVAVCRCGLSNDWPYCDGSHGNTSDEGDIQHKYRREDGELVRKPADVEDADPRA